MATFRLLRPHVIGPAHYEAGAIVSDMPNGEIPTGWSPPNLNEVEAMDGSALEMIVELERKQRTGA